MNTTNYYDKVEELKKQLKFYITSNKYLFKKVSLSNWNDLIGISRKLLKVCQFFNQAENTQNPEGGSTSTDKEINKYLKRVASIYKRKTSEGKPRIGRNLHFRLHLKLHPALHSNKYTTRLRDIAMVLKKMCPSLQSLHPKSILSTNNESKKDSSMPDAEKLTNTQKYDGILAIPVTSKPKLARKKVENQLNHSDLQGRKSEPSTVKYMELKKMDKNNLNTTSYGGNSFSPTNVPNIQIAINVTEQANKTLLQLYCEYQRNHKNYKGNTKSQLVNKEIKSRCSNHFPSPELSLKPRKHLRLIRQVNKPVTRPPFTSRQMQKGTPGRSSLVSSQYRQPIPSNFRKSNVLQGNNFRPFANIPQRKMTVAKNSQPRASEMPKTFTDAPISKNYQTRRRLIPQSSSTIPQVPRRLFSKITKNDPSKAAAQAPQREIPKMTTTPSIQKNSAPARARPQFTGKFPFQRPPMGPVNKIPKLTTKPSIQENRAPARGRPKFTGKFPFQRPPMGPAKVIPKITTKPSIQENSAPARGRPKFTGKLPFQRPPMGPAKIIPKMTTKPSIQENRAPARGRPKFTAKLPFQRPPMGPAKVIPKMTTKPSIQENRAPARGRPEFMEKLPFQRQPISSAKIIPKITTNPPYSIPPRTPAQIVPKTSQSTEKIVPFPPESTLQQARPLPFKRRNNIGSFQSSPNQQTEAADFGSEPKKVEYLGKANESLNTIRTRPSAKDAPLQPPLQTTEMNNIQPMSQSEENASPVVPSQSIAVPTLLNGEPVTSSLSPSKVKLPYLDGQQEMVSQDSFSSDLSNAEEASSTKYLLSQINNQKGDKDNQSNTPAGNIHIIEQHNIRGSSIIQIINENCGGFVSKSLDEFLNCLKATKLNDTPNFKDIAANLHHKVQQKSRLNTPAVAPALMKTPTRQGFLTKRNVEHVRNKRSATTYNRGKWIILDFSMKRTVYLASHVVL